MHGRGTMEEEVVGPTSCIISDDSVREAPILHLVGEWVETIVFSVKENVLQMKYALFFS